MEIAWLTIPKIIAAVVIGVILAICIANPVQYVSHPAQPVAVVTPVPTPQPVYIKPTEVPTPEPTPTLISMNELTQDLFPFPIWMIVVISVFFMFIFGILSGHTNNGIFLFASMCYNGIFLFASMCLMILTFMGMIDLGVYGNYLTFGMFGLSVIWLLKNHIFSYNLD